MLIDCATFMISISTVSDSLLRGLDKQTLFKLKPSINLHRWTTVIDETVPVIYGSLILLLWPVINFCFSYARQHYINSLEFVALQPATDRPYSISIHTCFEIVVSDLQAAGRVIQCPVQSTPSPWLATPPPLTRLKPFLFFELTPVTASSNLYFHSPCSLATLKIQLMVENRTVVQQTR